MVIGILIALQVNNWNEERKIAEVETEILNEILVDLEVSLRDLKNDLSIHKNAISGAEKLKHHVLNQRPKSDSVKVWLFNAINYSQFTPRTGGYKHLQSMGLDVIANNVLRNRIVTTYEIAFDFVLKSGRNYINPNNNPEYYLEPYFLKYLTVNLADSMMMEFNHVGSDEVSYRFQTSNVEIDKYDLFLADESLTIVLQKSVYERFGTIRVTQAAIERVDILIEEIQNELEN